MKHVAKHDVYLCALLIGSTYVMNYMFSRGRHNIRQNNILESPPGKATAKAPRQQAKQLIEEPLDRAKAGDPAAAGSDASSEEPAPKAKAKAVAKPAADDSDDSSGEPAPKAKAKAVAKPAAADSGDFSVEPAP